MKKKYITRLGIISLLFFIPMLSGCTNNASAPSSETNPSITPTETTTATPENIVKEFDMESFNTTIDGAYAPRFSLKEINVKKGDLVRINVNTTSGTHDIKIDEFNVFAETPQGKITTVEFTANQTGQFIYYCSKGNHRELGQWGKLIVTQ